MLDILIILVFILTFHFSFWLLIILFCLPGALWLTCWSCFMQDKKELRLLFLLVVLMIWNLVIIHSINTRFHFSDSTNINSTWIGLAQGEGSPKKKNLTREWKISPLVGLWFPWKFFHNLNYYNLLHYTTWYYTNWLFDRTEMVTQSFLFTFMHYYSTAFIKGGGRGSMLLIILLCYVALWCWQPMV